MRRAGKAILVLAAATCALAASLPATGAQNSRTLLDFGDSLAIGNDPGTVLRFSGYVRDAVRIAGPHRCVIWSTIVRPPYNGVSYDGYNTVLRRAARAYPNLRLLDWDGLARAHPQWFGSDGVHPSADGYRARAAAVAQVVKRCPS